MKSRDFAILHNKQLVWSMWRGPCLQNTDQGFCYSQDEHDASLSRSNQSLFCTMGLWPRSWDNHERGKNTNYAWFFAMIVSVPGNNTDQFQTIPEQANNHSPSFSKLRWRYKIVDYSESIDFYLTYIHIWHEFAPKHFMTVLKIIWNERLFVELC